MLENRGQVALEIVKQQKRAQEIGISPRAERIPRHRYDDERCNCGRVRETKCRSPIARAEDPKPDASASENHRARPFRKRRDTEPGAKQNDFRESVAVNGAQWLDRAQRTLLA